MTADSFSFVLAAGIPGETPVEAALSAGRSKSIVGVFDTLSVMVRQATEVQTFGQRAASPKTLIDIVDTWPVRSQHPSRGTCTAFNFAAQCEYLNSPAPAPRPTQRFSEEYLYSKMRRELHDLGPWNADTGATYLNQAIIAMQRFGLCPEEVLPYQGGKSHAAWSFKDTSAIDSDLDSNVLQDRSFFCWRPTIDDLWDPVPFDARLLAEVILTFDIPICISLPIYPDGDILPWTFGVGLDTGVIPEPVAGWEETPLDKISGHSVCLVGAVADDKAPGGGWFIFRNSWGPEFAARSTDVPALKDILRPGYGALSVAHVQQHCWEVALIEPSI